VSGRAKIHIPSCSKRAEPLGSRPFLFPDIPEGLFAITIEVAAWPEVLFSTAMGIAE
jgi:hypothetical protein